MQYKSLIVSLLLLITLTTYSSLYSRSSTLGLVTLAFQGLLYSILPTISKPLRICMTPAILGSIIFLTRQINALHIYSILKTLYYYGEFTFVLAFHQHQLRWQSFLINQSKEYGLAIFLSFAQTLLKHYFYEQSQFAVCGILGACISIAGLLLRMLAFATAQTNFTHLVSTHKKDTHTLITTGVYSFLRHPSYTGFYYFSMGSQLMLSNWICLIVFHFALTTFFRTRIMDEQQYLIDFFAEYREYRKRTWVLIPFL